MKRSQLNQLIQKTLNPLMTSSGFKYENMTYFRQCPTGVVHLLGFEFDPRTMDTFRVMCGVNSRMTGVDSSTNISDMAFIGAQHITRNGLDINSGRWPCDDEDSAQKSLSEIALIVPALVEPWYNTHQTLSSIASHMDSEHPRQGLDKAKLYLADGDPIRARAVLDMYVERLEQPKPWDDSDELDHLKKQAQSFEWQLNASGGLRR